MASGYGIGILSPLAGITINEKLHGEYNQAIIKEVEQPGATIMYGGLVSGATLLTTGIFLCPRKKD